MRNSLETGYWIFTDPEGWVTRWEQRIKGFWVAKGSNLRYAGPFRTRRQAYHTLHQYRNPRHVLDTYEGRIRSSLYLY